MLKKNIGNTIETKTLIYMFNEFEKLLKDQLQPIMPIDLRLKCEPAFKNYNAFVKDWENYTCTCSSCFMSRLLAKRDTLCKGFNIKITRILGNLFTHKLYSAFLKNDRTLT